MGQALQGEEIAWSSGPSQRQVWDILELKESPPIHCLSSGYINPQTGCVFLGNRCIYFTNIY